MKGVPRRCRGQPGQHSLRKEVLIIIGCAGRKAMTYTDLLGIVVAYEFLAMQLLLSYQNVVANETQSLITRVTDS